MKVLKAILNFFKNRKVQIWAACMVVVIIAAFGIMSWVMVANKIEFGRLRYTVGDVETEFVFMPEKKFVDAITFVNENEDFSRTNTRNSGGGFTLYNNMQGGTLDPVAFETNAKILEKILDELNNGRKTNVFSQFFTGGESGTDRLGTTTYTSQSEFEKASNGVWIRIVFDTPQFVLNYPERTDSQKKSWRIEPYNEKYERVLDEGGRLCGLPAESVYGVYYGNNVINAISIPLGNARDAFTQQTWYLSIGSCDINNISTLGRNFTTYGNYYKLLQYVSGLDDTMFI